MTLNRTLGGIETVARLQKPHITIQPCQHSVIPYTSIPFGLIKKSLKDIRGKIQFFKGQEVHIWKEGLCMAVIITNRGMHM